MDARIVGHTAGGAGAADPFGTAALRRRVLDAWAASPARFREDANAEEELALGGYRDRLVVELAQNAADAAARAGVPGRLRLTLRDGVLCAANTGAPLDAQGVESLSTLRASSKREQAGEGAVGRFGVGFAAVLAVSDEPAVLGRPGGVRWSLREAQGMASERPELADELRRRDGHVPLLRLPLPAEGSPPQGYDTVVVLPLRDTAALDLTRRLLDGIDDALLLTLTGLVEVVVEVATGPAADGSASADGRGGGEGTGAGSDGAVIRTLTRQELPTTHDRRGPAVVVVTGDAGESRWQVASAGGELSAGLLQDRTVEERHRPHWSMTWAVPVDANGAPQQPRTAPVVHAPTPTDEPLGVPALLIASFPLDSTRRHIAAGPLTDFLVEQAGDLYATLLRRRGADAATLELVPGPLGQGEMDARLRRAILARLPEVAFLPRAGHGGELPEPAPEEWDTNGRTESSGSDPYGVRDDVAGALRPRDAVLLEGADAGIVRALADVLPGLLPAGLERRQALRTLGVRRVPLAETVDQLANLEKDPSWWRNLYGALAGAEAETLGTLPVPLADGRMVTGPRRVLVPSGRPGDAVSAEDLALLGLRLVHPEAAHPLLEKLGAGVATPLGLLETAELQAAVRRSTELDDQEEAEEVAEAVLRIVRAAETGPGAHPWLARLALPDDEGELVAAGELVLPGSPLATIVDDDDAVFLDEEWLERWGPEVLRAVGVGHALGLVRAEEVVLDPDDLERLDPTGPADRAAGGEPTGLLDEAPDGFADWAEEVAEQLGAEADEEADRGGRDVPDVPPVAAELLAVRDLDLVADDAWPQALAMLAAPPLRDAVVAPVRLLLPDGRTAQVPSYTAWWLRDHPVLDGRRPAGLRAEGADPLLRGLYEEARTGLDAVFLHALGVRTTLVALLAEAEGPDEALYRMTDPDREVTHRQLHGLYTALASVELARIALPEEVRALPPIEPGTWRRPEGTIVVDVTEAVIADAPDLVQLLDGHPLITVAPALAGALAERLHVSLASEVAGGRVLSQGTVHRVPEEVRELLPGSPEVYEEHEELLVVGPDGQDAAVDWRWDADSPAPEARRADADGTGDGDAAPDAGSGAAAPDGGTAAGAGRDEFAAPVPYGALHAATPEGLAAGLAWAAGQWHRRFEVLAVLSDPDRAYELSAARDFE